MSKKSIKVKPGKTQSKLGFAVGLVFVLIGLTIAIPTFGLFGIFWTAIAAFITYTNFKNGFTDEGISTHEIVIDSTQADEPEEDIEGKLKTLDSLYRQGLISRDEYDSKRKELLDEF